MKNFWAYLQERFPLQANGVLIVSYFTANYLLARGALWAAEPLQMSWRFVAGCIVLLFMFFHIRLIDEHKDYEQDRIVHPERVLSRGLVTLTQLRRIGLGVVATELVLSYALGLPAFILCLILLVISWLIYKEFYIGEILGHNLILNALLHMLVMPLYSLFVFTVATGLFPTAAPEAVLLYAWVSYGVGLGYELSRKTRAPQDERPGLITYSAVMGPYPAAGAALLALLFSGAISLVVGVLLHFGLWYHVTVAALLLVVAAGVLHFRLRTSTATAANLPLYAGTFIFAFDILLAVELIRLHGVVFA
jgi:4-hydroxybenzoate polyprenyltransferase